MPKLKKASTPKRRYGGAGEFFLKNAINLLFQIKGAEYRKKHPDFVIPIADEFFGFVKLVDADLTKHYRTTHGICAKFRPITPDKDILLVSPHDGGSRLTDFLSFILKKDIEPHDTLKERFLACITIVVYAVVLFSIFEQFVKHAALDIVFSDTYKHVFADSLRWFLSHHLPSIVRCKKTLVDFSIQFLYNVLFPFLSSHVPEFPTIESISRSVISAVDTVIASPKMYNHGYKRPIASYLEAEGFFRC